VSKDGYFAAGWNAPVMGIVAIDVDLLAPVERRDLANSRLPAAWSVTLAETRILLLDLLVEVDAAVIGGAP
jgi:hypothetical protein